MPQPLSGLVRRASITTIDSETGERATTQIGDVRFVVTADGRACILNKSAAGAVQAVASAIGAEWRMEGPQVVVSGFGAEWRGQQDTRCGSCGGRYQLRLADPEPFLPQREQTEAP